MPIPTLRSSYKPPVSNDSVRDASVVQLEGQIGEQNTPTRGHIAALQNNAGDSKRRSLLPQPGQTVYNPRLTETISGNKSAQDLLPRRPRPKSIHQSVSFQADQDVGDKSTASRLIQPSTSISKPPAPSIAALGRSRSLRKPSTSAQPTQSSRPTAHSRAQSSSNISSQHRESSNTKAHSERPIISHVSTTSHLRSSNLPAGLSSTAPRASTRLAGLSRAASLRTTSDVVQGVQDSHVAPRQEVSVDTQIRRREVPRNGIPAAARPAFTTLQQHFTPRKTGKAPTSTFLQPVAAPSSDTLSSEILSLQAEILQLHLLHSGSAQAEQEWQSSARRGLSRKFEEVASLYQVMLKHESAGQEQKNLQALIDWPDAKQSTGLIEYIQILSGPLHELPSLIEPGGRFQRLAASFEQWMAWAEEVRCARLGLGDQCAESQSIEGPGDAWKAEAAAMTRKMTSYARDLSKLDPPSPGSGIAAIVETCAALLNGLLDGLQVMQSIVAEIAAKEKNWVESHLQAIAQDDSTHLVKTVGRAVWQM